MPVVRLLNGVSFEGPYAAAVAAIRQGLQDTGFVEGQNLAIEYRTADGQYGRLPDLPNDLVRSQVPGVIPIRPSPPPLVAPAATSTFPIFFPLASHPLAPAAPD